MFDTDVTPTDFLVVYRNVRYSLRCRLLTQVGTVYSDECAPALLFRHPQNFDICNGKEIAVYRYAAETQDLVYLFHTQATTRSGRVWLAGDACATFVDDEACRLTFYRHLCVVAQRCAAVDDLV